MTPSKLEESIEELRRAILDDDGLYDALRAFASAIREERREKAIICKCACEGRGGEHACSCLPGIKHRCYPPKPPAPQKCGDSECACGHAKYATWIHSAWKCEPNKQPPPREEYVYQHSYDGCECMDPSKCKCDCHNKASPSPLPAEVRNSIEFILKTHGEKIEHVRGLLEGFARLCLSLGRSK